MKILVTGGAGFIGGNFLQYMVEKYPEIYFVNMDKLTYASNLDKLANLKEKTNYRFIKGDILAKELLEDIFFKEKFTHVVNFAAETHVDRSINTPEIFVQTNVLGTQQLLACANKYDVTKFLQISTDEVYGSLDFNTTDCFTEKDLLNPSNPYAASKASADMLVLSYYKTFNLPINITRCSNNYGPHQFPEKLIPLTITKALNNLEIPLYGDGKNTRDWVHVLDHCRAIELVLFQGNIGEIYNVSGYNEQSNIAVVRKILRLLNKPEKLIKFVPDRLGHDKRYAINASKIKRTLDFKPAYTFEQGILEIVNWYVENQDCLNKKNDAKEV